MQLLDIKKSFKDQDVDLEWSPPALTHASDRFSSHDAPDVQIKKESETKLTFDYYSSCTFAIYSANPEARSAPQ